MKEDAKILWRFYSPSDISIVGKTRGDKLICRTDDHLVAVDLRNGLPVWRKQLDLVHEDNGKGPSISVVSDIITVGDKTGKSHLLQGETGSHFGMVETGNPYPQLLSKGTRFYYIVSSDTLICYNPATKAIAWMFEPIDKGEMKGKATNEDDWVTEDGLPLPYYERPRPSRNSPSHVEWVEYDKIEEFEGSRLVLAYIEWSMVWWYEADGSLSRANVPLPRLAVLEATTGSRIANLDAYAWPGETSKWQKIDNSHIILPEKFGRMSCVNVFTQERRWSYTHHCSENVCGARGLFGNEFATETRIHNGKAVCVFDGQEIVVLNGEMGILERAFKPRDFVGVGEILCFQDRSTDILVNYKRMPDMKDYGVLSAYDLKRGGMLWEMELDEFSQLYFSAGQLLLVKMGRFDGDDSPKTWQALILDPSAGAIQASHRFERTIGNIQFYEGTLLYTHSIDGGQTAIEALRV